MKCKNILSYSLCFFVASVADSFSLRGLGKTIQSVTLTYTLLHQGMYGTPTVQKAIIVAPSSLVKNWCKEFVK
jgi:hypothetical protein